MNRKTIFTLTAFALVVLLAGAYLLYGNLEAKQDAVQLAAAETVTVIGTVSESVTIPPEETTPPLATAPDFTVYDAEDNPVKLSDFFGKPIVLNFWASWCGPCKRELPDFQEKYDELGNSVQFLVVNLTDGSQETVETASAFLAEQGYTLPVYFDTQRSAAITYGVTAIPCTYFIDAQGCAIARASGAIDGQTLQRGIDMIQ